MDSRTVANEVVKRLRDEGYDAFRKGGYNDISGKVWEAIVSVLNETQPAERAVIDAALKWRDADNSGSGRVGGALRTK